MANEIPNIPPNMQKVYRRLRRWRSTHTGRLPIPESLWAAAAELARKHGINPTAKALHLEYGKFKQRAEAAMSAVKKRLAKAPADVPRRAALLRGFSSSGINGYVDVIMQRTAEEGKLRLPLCCQEAFHRQAKPSFKPETLAYHAPSLMQLGLWRDT